MIAWNGEKAKQKVQSTASGKKKSKMYNGGASTGE